MNQPIATKERSEGDSVTESPKPNLPMTEEQLLEVTIGERLPLNGTVYLAPYDPAWPSQFIRLKQRIQEALHDDILLLEHVGSTSVPGLPAKPIIDIVLVVADSSDEPSYVHRLEQKGFKLRIREADWYEHRMFKSADPVANLHVFSEGCVEIERMLIFRDWLRNNADDRMLYEETKRELAARTWKYTQNYADAKSEVIQEIMERARSDQT
jgi:GrpB-like predicted nucleotidyltransferase (UPF0157 family)